MGDVATLQSLRTLADTAFADGEYDVAIIHATRAKLMLAILPAATRNLAGGGSQALSWPNAVAIDGFIATCRQLQHSAARSTIGPIQSVPITYVRDNVDSAYE